MISDHCAVVARKGLTLLILIIMDIFSSSIVSYRILSSTLSLFLCFHVSLFLFFLVKLAGALGCKLWNPKVLEVCGFTIEDILSLQVVHHLRRHVCIPPENILKICIKGYVSRILSMMNDN